jgi:tRNA (cytidine/uridine-2'-O-)-methyltransferase
MEIVLAHPRIPQNVGSIARTCAATYTPLHIIEPIPFEISEKAVQRAGLDYWPHVNLTMHPSFDHYYTQRKGGKIWLVTKFATPLHHQVAFGSDDALLFGSEESGIPPEIKTRFPDTQIRIAMPCSAVRSLNLSNAVSIVLYEARRQLGLDV